MGERLKLSGFYRPARSLLRRLVVVRAPRGREAVDRRRRTSPPRAGPAVVTRRRGRRFRVQRSITEIHSGPNGHAKNGHLNGV